MDTSSPTPPLDENKLIAERREKLAAIRAQGGVAFPNDFKPANRAADLVAKYGQLTNEELEPQEIQVSVGGRMMLKRTMGKAAFCSLQDAMTSSARRSPGARSTGCSCALPRPMRSPALERPHLTTLPERDRISTPNPTARSSKP